MGIRRIIDYGVGYKGDIKKLNIPEAYNEGFWNIKDIEKALGQENTQVYWATYRHFGDPDGDTILEFLNKFVESIDKVNGTNFISAWLKSA